MLGFIYQALILIAVFVALPFQRNWSDPRLLLVYALGAIVLIDTLIIIVSLVFVRNKLYGLSYLDFPIEWLPLIAPAIAWYYAEKIIKNRHDYN